MAAAVAMLVVGLSTPALLRRPSAQGVRPRLTIAAQLSGLVLVWAGVVGVATAVVWPGREFLELCRAVVSAPSLLLRPLPIAVLVLVAVMLPGRAAVRTVEVAVANRRIRRCLNVPSRGVGVVTTAMSTVACTIGAVRPRVVVDPVKLAELSDGERLAVLEHERGHARQRHGLVDVVAQALAAGVAPWPGARVALADVRRQLEAAADDRAARRTSPRTVVDAIVTVACGAPPAGALGASGSALWRVDRLLCEPSRDRRCAPSALGVLALVGLVFGHWMLHSVHLLSGWRLVVLAEVCCTM